MENGKTTRDENNNKMNKSSESQTSESFGKQLKNARESMGLTVEEVAARLYLAPKIIRAMEEDNNFIKEAPITFMRGYLRSYAKLLDIPQNIVKIAMENIQPEINPQDIENLPKPLTNKTSIENERYISYGTYIIAFILIGLVVMWWRSYNKAPSIENEIASIQTVPTLEKSTNEPLKQLVADTVNHPEEAINDINKPIELASPAPAPVPKNDLEAKDDNIIEILKNNAPEAKPNTDAIQNMIIPEP